jgi:hypothetical protein
MSINKQYTDSVAERTCYRAIKASNWSHGRCRVLNTPSGKDVIERAYLAAGNAFRSEKSFADAGDGDDDG